MKILYLGDIVGEKTLDVLEKYLPQIQKEEKINLIFANAENVTSGKGLCQKHYKKLMEIGISAVTMGNHTYSKKDIFDYIDDAKICRPANISKGVGKEVVYINYNNQIIALVNLLGRVYQPMLLDCPFKTMDRLLQEIKADYIIVDVHADATSEKKALFYDLAGKVSCVLGSHTHTQTADEQVYNNTCFISDMGMNGPYESILGDDKDMVIERFRSGIYNPLKVANTNEYLINGVIIDLQPSLNKIKRYYKIVNK